MRIEEFKQDAKRRKLIESVTNDAANLLDVDLSSDLPSDIIDKIDESIVSLVLEKKTPILQDDNPDLLLASLWGEQMKRQFNWYWADVLIDGEYNEIAMISPNKEMIIFPFSFVSACIDKCCICTVSLAFNMLLENTIGEIEPNSYLNIMQHITHIVPPYTLE